MTDSLTVPPSGVGYLGTEPMTDLSAVRTDFAFLGVPFGQPYVPTDLIEGSTAPDEIRKQSARYETPESWSRYDFDFGRVLFPGDIPNVTDVGNVRSEVRDIPGTKARVTEAVRQLLAAGTVPIVQGGLDNIPPLVVAAYEGQDIGILQIDAHLDYRDEVKGIRDGYSSPMRRVREFPQVKEMVQIGLRGRGSAGIDEYRQALDDGNVLITAAELRRRGMADVIAGLDPARKWFVSLDVDGLDPSFAPGVYVRSPGGVSFADAFDLLSHLSRSRTLAGALFAEYMPELDVADLTALTVIRLQEAILANW